MAWQPSRVSDQVAAAASALLTRLPNGAFFCGPTAAVLLGIPLPAPLETGRVLHVGVRSPHRQIRRRGIAGHKLDLGPEQIRLSRGIPITDPARTWRDLAEFVGVDDLVAAGDSVLHGERPLASLTDLAAAVDAAAGGRGAVKLRQALELVDGRSASRAETRLRLLLMRAGIGGLEPNFWVTLPNPRTRFRIDIAFPALRLGLEYQSEYHHDIDQWRADMTRLSRLRAHGWNMVEVSARDLNDPVELADRVTLLLARA